ncbi:STAS domain-containing protein [candidate division KSB1 bacterium]|nr:STAS domain-containing protein [candidate division KSB1 bacterium]
MNYQTIAVEQLDKILVIRVLERRIFLKIADNFKEEITKCIENDVENLIIDLSQVNVMNSSGLGVLILARDKMLKQGGKLILCGLRSVMTEIFNRMHLNAFFTITDDIEKARRLIVPG